MALHRSAGPLPASEERAQKLVALQFFLLAPYVTFEAVQALINSEHPEVSGLGMALTASSIIGMPLLGIAKQRVAKTLGSQATHGEGTQNLLCAYLAAAVFLGLAGNALFGAWWLDPIAALVIAGIALREGMESWAVRVAAPPRLWRRARPRARTTAAPTRAELAMSRTGRFVPGVHIHRK